MGRPYVILGAPESLFVRQLARFWRSTGTDVVVVKLRGEDGALPDGTPVLSGEAGPNEANLRRRIAGRALHELWRLQTIVSPSRHHRSKNDGREQPSFVGPLTWGGPAARRAQALRPAFVFGQEAFAYGVATALCRDTPRILMPWGGDVFWYPDGSPLSFAMVRWALRSVDLVCPTSSIAGQYIEQRFGVPQDRVRTVSWGVDRPAFPPLEPSERVAIRESLGLDPSRPVILSVRRFLPGWGSEAAFEAFLRLCASYPRPVSFVVFGGAGSEPYIRAARARIAGSPFQDRFRFFEETLPLAECARVMAASDIFLSLMGTGDMRSASVLQAACAGAAPILAEHPEYRAISRLGFRALFVDPADPDAVAAAIRRYLDDACLCAETRASNDRYLASHEDSERQMHRLLEIVLGVANSTDRIAR